MQNANLYFIAMAEGFVKFKLNTLPATLEREEVELIEFKGFTTDCRKASVLDDSGKAIGVAKFIQSERLSKKDYFAILQTTTGEL